MDTLQVFRALRSWWRVIVVVTIVAGANALVLSQFLPREYTAASRVLVGSITDPTTDKLTAYQQMAQTFGELATTTPVLERVATKIGGVSSLRDLASRIDARAGLGETIITVTARAASAAEAATLANTVADEITAMATPDPSSPSLASLVQPASLPESPSSPRTSLNVVIAAALGFLLSSGGALYAASRPKANRGLSLGDRSSDGRLAVRELPLRLIQVHPVRESEIHASPAFDALVASVRELGVLEPVLVRPVEDGQFEVIAGERRVRAALAVGLESIAAVVRDLDDATAVTLMAAVEAPPAPRLVVGGMAGRR